MLDGSVVVIGAGVAGLAASIRLACSGYKVDVYETAAQPGGKLSQFSLGPYRFDRGPSLFTMPHWVDELFALAGENPVDHFRYLRLDPVTSYFFADGTRFTAWSERERLIEEFRIKLGESPESVRKYLERAARKYAITAPFFVEASLHRVETYLTSKLPGAVLALPELEMLRSMDESHRRQFRDPRTIQLFNRYATYNGSDPFQAPATLTLIPHLEFNVGAFLPDGGMFRITEALYGLALRLGVKFHFDTAVNEIVVENGRVTGVESAKGLLKADAVLSNADVFTTYRKLLPKHAAPERILRQPRSSSALIFYWGVRGGFDELDVHNIFFSGDYRREFEQIFQEKTMPDEPTVYVNITSKKIVADAPPGGENWFVLVNAPANTGQDWDSLIPVARERVLDALSQRLRTDLRARVECEAVFEPRTIESLTGSWQGALYGNSSNNRMAAFLRHANKSRRIRGLYFCGGSVHPGGGIPLCLQSGKIAAQLIAEDVRD